MKIAIFSDVHGNLSALQAVLESINQQPDLDETVFAGDLCIFGPRPQACVELMMDADILAIGGNTDEWIFQPPPVLDNLSNEQKKQREFVRSICRWTRGQLTQEAANWIDQSCRTFQLRFAPNGNESDGLLIVHANPVDINQLIFPPEADQLRRYGRVRQRDDDLAPLLLDIEAATIAFGHLHIPFQRPWDNKNLVNVSSVSMPGDGDSRAKYVILSWSAEQGWNAKHILVSYEATPEIEAFRRRRPPGWQSRVDSLVSIGHVPQIV